MSEEAVNIPGFPRPSEPVSRRDGGVRPPRFRIAFAKRGSLPICAVVSLLPLLAGCGQDESGPIAVGAIGGPPALVNPNLVPLDPPKALMAETAAQGLVRFEASGQIQPALAQRWIVSNDGLRYTFRLAPLRWSGGGGITAAQVAGRLRAAMRPTSRNRLKPLLGAIDEIEAMTDDVLEISLRAPRPRFLDLLAQPEMAIMHNGQGSGPFRGIEQADGSIMLTRLPPDDGEDAPPVPKILLRGQRAALAVALFRSHHLDLVTGGTAGDLPIARAAVAAASTLRFDPVGGLFGLRFTSVAGPLADPHVRDALSMAIDRASLVAALDVPNLQPRESILPVGIQELPAPAQPAWQGLPLQQRRAAAARTIANLTGPKPLPLRVAVPRGPGYRLVFALLRSSWRTIGVEPQAVGPEAPADLRLIDEMAPVGMASWYLRSFACAASAVCSADADRAMDAARIAPSARERRESLASADAILRDTIAFIPLTAPVRWSLVARRLTGFQPNVFAYHAPDGLIADAR